MRNIWLDCDPGHDDVTALLLAIHIPDLKLLGVSTVHGNTDSNRTFSNALRCLYAFGAPADVHVYPGAPKPLLKPAKHDAEIHGPDGLGGVEGLPEATHPSVQARLANSPGLRAIEGIARAVRETWRSGKGQKMVLVSSGPMTNIALFMSVYPELLDGLEEIVFMGGGVGVGNRSAVAEYNIHCDPEAAQIVLNTPVKKTMIPLNVTHTAILTESIHRKLLSPNSSLTSARPPASTPLRHTLSTLMSFFAAAYASTFGFTAGPPLHDALTIAYVSQPTLFTCKRRRVDIELTGTHTTGETVVDIWEYKDVDETWGAGGKNCLVAESLDVPAFFDILLDCVERCDKVSPLNK